MCTTHIWKHIFCRHIADYTGLHEEGSVNCFHTPMHTHLWSWSVKFDMPMDYVGTPAAQCATHLKPTEERTRAIDQVDALSREHYAGVFSSVWMIHQQVDTCDLTLFSDVLLRPVVAWEASPYSPGRGTKRNGDSAVKVFFQDRRMRKVDSRLVFVIISSLGCVG